MLLLATPQAASTLPSVLPLRPSGLYARDERAGWSVATPGGTGKWRYEIRRNDAMPILSGEFEGSKILAVTESQPAMLTLRLTPSGGKPILYGAAVAPRELRPVEPRPRDFDAFWNRKLTELRRVPANPVLTTGASPRAEVEYGTLRMDHLGGTGVYGQWAKPKRAGRFPAVLQLQWAGGPYPLDPNWVLGRAAQGFLVLNIQPHDVLPTEPPAYYAALPERLKSYHTIGMEDREVGYFVAMYLRGVRAADYLASRPDWDGRTLVVTGTSMGGQQSFAVAALHRKVTHLIANEAAGCDLSAPLHGRSASYPFLPAENPKVRAASRYIDNVHMAPRIRATSLVAMGFRDDVTAPAGIWTAFNLIRGAKEAVPKRDAPHSHIATPQEQRPWSERSEAWFAALAAGKSVPVR